MKIYFRYALLSLFGIVSQLQPILAQDKLDSYPDSVIYFGHGGGFTGLVNTYALLQNGDLYKKKFFCDQEWEYISKTDSSETRSIFANYSFLGIHTMQLSEPGNTYSFISMLHKNAEVKPGTLRVDNITRLGYILQHLARVKAQGMPPGEKAEVLSRLKLIQQHVNSLLVAIGDNEGTTG